jgi:ribose/xylose/arabinose/galactoside ABC-type transport system permease subunit
VELLIAAVIGGVLLAGGLMVVIWKVVSGAVENGLDWLIHNFGNERAAREVEEKWRTRPPS